jgi:hypothetical protein
LDAHDLLEGLDDDTVLTTRWRVAPDVTQERHHLPGAADPAAVLLRQTDGFARAVPVGTALAATVGACDGELPLGAIAGAVAALLDLPTGQVRAQAVAGVRQLAADAFLSPA